MRSIYLNTEIAEALAMGGALAISISGGKDSHALLVALVDARRRFGWTGPFFAIHADLGRAEWAVTGTFCRNLCANLGVDLVVVSREAGDLLQEMEDRRIKLAGSGKPHFPSASARYCTSDQKRNPIDKHLRQYDIVISAEGVRRQESAARSKKAGAECRSGIATKSRHALTWRPLIDWTEDDVWEAIGVSRADLDRRRRLYAAGNHYAAFAGWPAHPAYVIGNERLSCSICMLASRGDIINGARHNPEYYRALVAQEEASGFAFRSDLRLGDLEI